MIRVAPAILLLLTSTSASAQLTPSVGGPPAATEEPPAPTNYAADRFYDPRVMAEARAQSHQEHGGETFSMVILNLAEYQADKGKDAFRWEGEGWYGGDLHRFVVKTEGDGAVGGALESAEVQTLYSRAIGPYFNLQAGVRYDLKPDPSRLYAALGVEGLAPYFIETQAALFVSNKGDILGRVEAYYDQLVTQQLILQPRVEMNFAARDVPENRIGAGLYTLEIGLRLRYEFEREFAPYIGLSYSRKVGATGDFARIAGERTHGTGLVAGIRTWF